MAAGFIWSNAVEYRGNIQFLVRPGQTTAYGGERKADGAYACWGWPATFYAVRDRSGPPLEGISPFFMPLALGVNVGVALMCLIAVAALIERVARRKDRPSDAGVASSGDN